jgi:hypothetical protein
MKNKNATLSIFLVILLLLIFVLKRWKEPVAREAFNRHPSHLLYTKHALCRMGCRHISEEEIKEIMDKGIINFNKSNKGDRPCPTFAMQGHTTSGENIRVIFAQCKGETKVITCYNLSEEFSCNCPGDENKN